MAENPFAAMQAAAAKKRNAGGAVADALKKNSPAPAATGKNSAIQRRLMKGKQDNPNQANDHDQDDQ